jgi:hypothetical protein
MRPYLPQALTLGITKPLVEVEHCGNFALVFFHPYKVLHSKVSTSM